ncbi:MAG: hypothetical protein HY270_21585, partial [Deltaproteobacteria bacterium]|nr:hypothetical protein [Deltaproteobacteria bacterium]
LQYELVIGDTVLVKGTTPEALELAAEGTIPLVLPVEMAIDRLVAAAKGNLTFGEVPYELRVSLLLAATMLERQVTLAQSSVLQIDLPLGLVRQEGLESTVDSRQKRLNHRKIQTTVDPRLSTCQLKRRPHGIQSS